MIFFCILLLPDIVNANFVQNDSWIDSNLSNSAYSSFSSSVSGDIDNDGDIDIVISGCDSSVIETCNPEQTNVYLNNETAFNISAGREISLDWGMVQLR